MQSVSDSYLYAFDLDEYIFVDRLDKVNGNDNDDDDDETQFDDDSYDYCDDNSAEDYDGNDETSFQPSEPPMSESIDMSKVVDDVLKNSILMKELDEAHAAASLDVSKQEQQQGEQKAGIKGNKEENQTVGTQEDKEETPFSDDISAKAPAAYRTLEKEQASGASPCEPSEEPRREHLTKSNGSDVEEEEDETLCTSTTSSATSRASNKKRRKKLKLLKKAKAAENAAQALSGKTTRPALQSARAITKVNERKQASRKIRTLTTGRSGRKVSNIAVACATETLTAYRKELIMKGQPCT